MMRDIMKLEDRSGINKEGRMDSRQRMSEEDSERFS